MDQNPSLLLHGAMKEVPNKVMLNFNKSNLVLNWNGNRKQHKDLMSEESYDLMRQTYTQDSQFHTYGDETIKWSKDKMTKIIKRDDTENMRLELSE